MTSPLTSEWITAHAGSGKTYRLTRRVVRLLLMGVPPERIVCITYTKAAASEMRARVLALLRRLLLADEAECCALVEEITHSSATPEMQVRARQLFGQVMDSPGGGLTLVTIHGFCQELLRRFPLEAGISPHFTVLEDQAAERMRAHVKTMMLRSIGSSCDPFTKALELIGERSGEARFDALVSDILSKRNFWDEVWRATSPERLQEQVWLAHGLEVEITAEKIVERLQRDSLNVDAAALRVWIEQWQTSGKKTEQKLAEGLLRWLQPSPATQAEKITEFCALFLTNEGKVRAHLIKLEAMVDGGPLSLLTKAVQRYHRDLAAFYCAEESFAVAVLARSLLDLYALAKAEAHALDYDDLINHSLQLVSLPETLGWVMSKLDYRVDHLLVDEAQDNSTKQWQLVQVLVEELVAAGGDSGSANVPRTTLVVGDEKQSIYSFQGAAPEQFQVHRKRFQHLLEGNGGTLAEVKLEDSYRSSASILKLVNTLCLQPMMRGALGQYEPANAHRLVHSNLAGRVSLYPLLIAPESVVQPAMTLPQVYQDTKTAPELLAQEIAAAIDRWIHQEKRLSPNDVLILVHRRTPMVAPLIRALQQRKVPVAGMDRLILSEHLAVRDLLALMAWVMNPADDLALAQVLRSPMIGWSDAQLCAVACGRNGSLWQAIEDPWLTEMLTYASATPYHFLTHVLEVSGKRRAFSRRFGTEVHEVLDELKAQAVLKDRTHVVDLARFHETLTRSERSIKREQEISGNHVRIMTVHGAKGLEAPVVILADTIQAPTTQRERLFVHTTRHGQKLPVLAFSDEAKQSALLVAAKEEKKQALQAEYKRLLYVAVTRAIHELHVFGHTRHEGKVQVGSWYDILEQTFDACGAEVSAGIRSLTNAGIWKEERRIASEMLAAPDWLATRYHRPHACDSLEFVGVTRMSQKQTPSAYVTESAAASAARGVRIHRVLEHLTAHSRAGDILALVKLFAADWSEDEQQAVSDEIMALYQKEHWLWQHPRKTELAIVGTIRHKGVETAVQGQIDLLVETPEALIIVDYKTGGKAPALVTQIPPEYTHQLACYRALVAKLYPKKPVRCSLLWTGSLNLMWLDDSLHAMSDVA